MAASAAAQARGVRPPLPLVEARALLGAGLLGAGSRAKSEPPAIVAAWDPTADLLALRELAETLSLEISPLVALEPLQRARWAGQPLHQPDSLLLDITGSGAWFGDETRLLEATGRELRRGGWEARMAIAPSSGAAWALAHTARREQPAELVVPLDEGREVAWNLSPERDIATATAGLPTLGLRLPVEAAQKLQRLGIQTIGGLLRLPRGGLASRLGPELLERIDQLLGRSEPPLPVHHAAPEFTIAIDLEYPSDALDLLKDRLQRAAEQLSGRLAKHHFGALRVTCRLELAEQPPQAFRLGLFMPTADAPHLTMLLHGLLDQQPLAGKVARIVLAAPLTGSLQTYQPSLLEPTASGRSAGGLPRLVDTLSSRLGRQRVVGVRPSDDPLPEAAFQTRPLAGQPQPASPTRRRRRGRRTAWASKTVAPSPAAGNPNALARPIDLLRRPRPLVIDEVRDDGRPAAIRLRRQGKPLAVLRCWGPERIETGWWQGPMTRRDYYRVETDSGQWLWVFRVLKTNRWFLHGWFG